MGYREDDNRAADMRGLGDSRHPGRSGRGIVLLAGPALVGLAVHMCERRKDCDRREVAAMGPGYGPDKFARHMRGPGARFFERGGIKFAILELLKDKPRHGYEIIREMEDRSGGFYSPSPGAVYPTLQALEDQDLVTSATEEGKRVYSIAEAGLSYLEGHKEQARGHRERWQASWGPDVHGEARVRAGEMREMFGDVIRAVRRSAGDSEKMNEIREILRDAAKKVDEIAKR